MHWRGRPQSTQTIKSIYFGSQAPRIRKKIFLFSNHQSSVLWNSDLVNSLIREGQTAESKDILVCVGGRKYGEEMNVGIWFLDQLSWS